MSNKCKVCTKSVYPVDPQLNLDGALFHKSCAKCADCKCQITVSNFSKTETAEKQYLLLCKTHYFARFNANGGTYVGGEKFKKDSSEKYTGAATFAGVNVATSSPVPRKDAAAEQTSATVVPERRKSVNIGATAANKCKTCGLTVYAMDAHINLDGALFHKACAKCADCQSQITIENFVKNGSSDQLLCKTHYLERFATQGGAYVGGEKFKVKNARDVNAEALAAVAASPVRANVSSSDSSSGAAVSKPAETLKKPEEDLEPEPEPTVFQSTGASEIAEPPVHETNGNAVEV